MLTGFMGAGKSSVGRILAKRLGWSFLDLDEQIQRDTGATIREIFEKQGEEAFRELEARAVALVPFLNNFVIATGGGAVLREENRAHLSRSGFVVNLYASADAILSRLSPAHLRERPLIAGKTPEETRAAVEKLLAEREPFYAQADFRLDTTALAPEEAAAEILRRLPDRLERQR